jgi:hypothetical protein
MFTACKFTYSRRLYVASCGIAEKDLKRTPPHLQIKVRRSSEPVFVNVYGDQESIPRNRFRQAGNRFLGSLKVLQIQAQDSRYGVTQWLARQSSGRGSIHLQLCLEMSISSRNLLSIRHTSTKLYVHELEHVQPFDSIKRGSMSNFIYLSLLNCISWWLMLRANKCSSSRARCNSAQRAESGGALATRIQSESALFISGGTVFYVFFMSLYMYVRNMCIQMLPTASFCCIYWFSAKKNSAVLSIASFW